MTALDLAIQWHGAGTDSRPGSDRARSGGSQWGVDMKNRVLGFASLTLAALLCVALPAFGQTSMQFVSSTSEYGDPFGSDQTGLYGAVVGGIPTLMICDDATHSIVDGETWQANGINAASLNSTNIGSTEFGVMNSAIGLFGYTELAYLVNQMFLLGNTDPTDKGLISQAIWYITSGVASQNTWSTAASKFATDNPGTTGLMQFGNLVIYTPISGSQSAGGTPQEMWVEVSEGGAALMYLLLAGVSCFGAMFFRSRRHSANPGIA